MNTPRYTKLAAALVVVGTVGCLQADNRCCSREWSNDGDRATFSESDDTVCSRPTDNGAGALVEESSPKRSPWAVVDGWTKSTAKEKRMYKEIHPKDAKAELDANTSAIYLDVRSQAEFAESHAPGAINIPLLEPDATGAMTPNPEFPKVVEAIVPRDAKVIVGCKSGGRSAHAADFMINSGWKDVSNLTGGFHGQSNMLGQTVSPGWLACDLPSTQTPKPGKSYMELRARATE